MTPDLATRVRPRRRPAVLRAGLVGVAMLLGGILTGCGDPEDGGGGGGYLSQRSIEQVLD